MRLYYGWLVTVICALILMLVMGSTVSVYGLYVLPVAREYGLDRADVNTAFVIANLGGAVQAPFIGRLIDTVPIRRIMTIGAVFYSVTAITIALTHNIWLSAALLAALMPWAIGGLGTSCCMTLVTRWFQAQRARAMAIVVIGMSLGAVIMPPVVGWLIEAHGWRTCAMLIGGVLGLLFLGLIAILREKPGVDDVEPVPLAVAQAQATVAAPPPQTAMSTREILTFPLFWIFALSMALYMGLTQAISITLVPMAQEGGISVTASAGLLSVMGVTAIAGKFVLVWIGDRFDKALTLSILMVLVAAVVMAMPFASTWSALAVCAGLFGVFSGVTLPLIMALLADYVGAASFGSANGIATLMVAVSGASTMRLSGDIYDRTGGYHALFVVLTVLAVISSALMLVSWKMARARPVAVVA